MLKALEENAMAQVEVDRLSAQMTRLDLRPEAISDRTLEEVGKMVAKAGLRVAERARKQEGRAVLQYQLLQAMVRICGDDQNLMIETRVLPVKEILENQQGSVVSHCDTAARGAVHEQSGCGGNAKVWRKR